MFAKSGFVLRSLFVSFLLGSLVACTFEGGQEEEKDSTSSEVSKKGSDKDPATLDGEDAGPYDDDADAGPWDNDAGPYDHDGGDGGHNVDGGGSDGGHYGDGGGSDGGHYGDGGSDAGYDGDTSKDAGGW